MDLKVKAEKQEVKADKIEVDKHYRDNAYGLALHMVWVYKWWKEFGPAIRTISPRMAGAINDNFIDGHSFATYFIDKSTWLCIDDYFFFFLCHLTHIERMALEYRNK